MKLAALSVVSAFALLAGAVPAAAGMAACASAYKKESLDDQIRLYTTCLDDLWHEARAGAYHNRGVAYFNKGDLTNALADLNVSISYDDDYGLAYYNRAIVNAAEGYVDDAIADLSRAIELPPSRVKHEALFRRALLLQQTGDYAGAIADLDVVIERARPIFDPQRRMKEWQRTRAMYAKALILATASDPAVRNPAAALELAQAALARDDTAGGRAVLAAAYAAGGRFEDAAREQALAVQMGDAAGGEVLASYQQGQAVQTASLGCDMAGNPATCGARSWEAVEMHVTITGIDPGGISWDQHWADRDAE